MDSRHLLLTTFLLYLVCLAFGPLKADEQHSLEQNLANEKTLMLADSVDFDQHKDIVRARGHVQVARDKMTLYADEITYDRKADLIVAQGNVRLVDADNNMSFAHRIELSGDFKEGVAHAIRGIMADDALFAANSIKRTKGTRNQFNQVAYTPCEVCRSDPHKSPTWQIKSRHMIWDEVSGDITHADARLEIGDIPVIYTPYLSHPGPTVKRRSGFLSAILGGGGGLGAIVGVPYFWAIDKDKDLTVTPFYTKENPLLWWVYRHSFCQGFFKFESSVTHSKYKRGPTNREKVENRLRGHVKTSALVNITRNWRAGFNIHRTLDDTYLKKYRFLGQTRDHFLTSDLYAESFWKRNYARIEAISFQSLTQNDSASHIPFITPSAEVHLLSRPHWLNGTYFFDASLLNIQRRRGMNVKRLSSDVGWKVQWVGAWGTLFDLKFQGRGDLYQTSKLLVGTAPYTGTRHRFIPQAQMNLGYPLYQALYGGRFVMEPLVGLTLSGAKKNSVRIPNEDSSLFELSDANLFALNRFSGLDRVDEWSRVTYGLKFAYFSKSLGNSELFFGQSDSLKKVPATYNETGLRSRQSDYVARGTLTYRDWLTLESRLLLNKKALKEKRNESSLSLGQPIFKMHATYTRFPKLTIPGLSSKQMTYGVSSLFTEHWTIAVDVARALGKRGEFGKGGNLSQGASLTYEDECFRFVTSVTKNFYQDRDLRPGVMVLFRFSFKNLGDVAISGDQLGLKNSPVSKQETEGKATTP